MPFRVSRLVVSEGPLSALSTDGVTQRHTAPPGHSEHRFGTTVDSPTAARTCSSSLRRYAEERARGQCRATGWIRRIPSRTRRGYIPDRGTTTLGKTAQAAAGAPEGVEGTSRGPGARSTKYRTWVPVRRLSAPSLWGPFAFNSCDLNASSMGLGSGLRPGDWMIMSAKVAVGRRSHRRANRGNCS
jgi:hypothetical protein